MLRSSRPFGTTWRSPLTPLRSPLVLRHPGRSFRPPGGFSNGGRRSRQRRGDTHGPKAVADPEEGRMKAAPVRHRLPAFHRQDVVDRRREGRSPVPQVRQDVEFSNQSRGHAFDRNTWPLGRAPRTLAIGSSDSRSDRVQPIHTSKSPNRPPLCAECLYEGIKRRPAAGGSCGRLPPVAVLGPRSTFRSSLRVQIS